MSDQAPVSPEHRHSQLIEAIEHELAIYGPSSLAEVIACLLENYFDEDEPMTPEQLAAKRARDGFHALAYDIAAIGALGVAR